MSQRTKASLADDAARISQGEHPPDDTMILEFKPRTRPSGTPRQRMIMVPEEDWLQVMAALREWKLVSSGCPMSRRLLET